MDKIDISCRIDLEDVIRYLNYEQAIELIKAIDKVQANWDFTQEIFEYFEEELKEEDEVEPYKNKEEERSI